MSVRMDTKQELPAQAASWIPTLAPTTTFLQQHTLVLLILGKTLLIQKSAHAMLVLKQAAINHLVSLFRVQKIPTKSQLIILFVYAMVIINGIRQKRCVSQSQPWQLHRNSLNMQSPPQPLASENQRTTPASQ